MGLLQAAYAEALKTEACSDLLQQFTTAVGLQQLQQFHACFTNAVCQAAQEAGVRQSGTGTVFQPGLSMFPWFSHECRQLRRQLRAAARTPPRSPEVRALQRQFQALLRRKLRRYNQEQLHELCQLLRSDPRKFWQQVPLRTSLLPDLPHLYCQI